jgi:hypothetical protein
VSSAWSLRGFDAVVYKELRQIVRSPATLALAIMIPTLQMILLGYAINTTVEHVPSAVYRGRSGPSGASLSRCVARLALVRYRARSSKTALRCAAAIVAGRVRVGFDIPENFTADLIAGRRPAIGVLVDGSDSAIAQVAYGSAGAFAGIPLRGVTDAGPAGLRSAPARALQPAMRSADFFVPGLIGLVMQNITVLLTALAIVGERERGTLDQLLVTPIGSAGLMLGKLLPYALIAAAILRARADHAVRVRRADCGERCAAHGAVRRLPRDRARPGIVHLDDRAEPSCRRC